MITGEHLKIARIIYGYATQESLAEKMGTNVATVQRHEAMSELSYKVIGEYEHRAHFDLSDIANFVRIHRNRLNTTLQYNGG